MNTTLIDNIDNLKTARHEFDLLKPPSRQRIDLKRCTSGSINQLNDLANKELPGRIACVNTIRNVLSYNRNNILLFNNNDKVVGFWAMLMLNHIGLEKLLLGELDTLDPPLKCLSLRLDMPVAIYVWATVASGIATEGIKHVSHFLNQPIYKNTNLFARPINEAGKRMNETLGFKPLECGTDRLHRYERLANRTVVQRAA